MTTLRMLLMSLKSSATPARFVALPAGLLFLLLSSGCGTTSPQAADALPLPAATRPPARQAGFATPTVFTAAESPGQAGGPSVVEPAYNAESQPYEEYGDASLYSVSDVIKDAVRAQFDAYSFRVYHEYSQVNTRLDTGDAVAHTYTSTAEIMPPGMMHSVMVSNMFEIERGKIYESIQLGEVEYRKEQREDLTYHWVKTQAQGTPFDRYQLAYSFWDYLDQMAFARTESLDGVEMNVYEHVKDEEGSRRRQTVWISVEDGYLRKVEIAIDTFIWEDKTAVATSETLASFVFCDYDADMTIEAPSDYQ